MRAAFAALLLLIAVTLFGCRPGVATQAASPDSPDDPPPKVKAAILRLENWPQVVRVQGSLLADEISIVGAEVANRVKEVKVDLGSEVRRGDVLVAMDTEELDFRVQQAEAQLEQARAKLGLKPADNEESLDRLKVPLVVEAQAVWNQAQTEYDRARDLLSGKAIAAEEVQQRQAALLVAEAKYRAAGNEVIELAALVAVKRAELGLVRQNRIDALIRAPFDGIVQQRHVAPGSYLQVGQAVATLVRTNPLRFQGGVPEREATRVQVGQSARITIEGQTTPLCGQIARICPALDMSNRALRVEIDLPDPESRLHVGLFGEAEIVIDPSARTLAAPATAVYEFAGVEKIWVVRDGTAAPAVVQTGRRNAEHIEILQGVSAGDVMLIHARAGSLGPVTVEMQDAQLAGRP